MRKIVIKTNGCAVLIHETERVAKYFVQNGWEVTEQPQEADILFVTCCGVTHNEEDEAIGIIRDLEHVRPATCRMIVSGCMPQFARERVLEVAPEAVILSQNELHTMDKYIGAKVPFESVHYNTHPIVEKYCDPREKTDENLRLMRSIDAKNHTTVCEQAWEFAAWRKYLWQGDDSFQIRVSYGCSSNCSYCATKLGIGAFRSVPMETVLQQYREGLEQGYSRFVLVGDEIGAYGRETGSSLPALLEQMHQMATRPVTVAIRYIHPDLFARWYEQLKPFFASGFVNYFCSAFQSGSPAVLKRMNRNPNIEPFVRCMEDLNAAGYAVNKHTQIIVGFPGETAEDVLLTMDVLRRCRFDHININIYSPRAKTAAYAFGDDVTAEQKAFRAALIRHTMWLHKKALLYDAIRTSMQDA